MGGNKTLKTAADALRSGKGHMPWGSGKLENADGDGLYTEYFWAKDLVRYIEANPGKLDFALQRGKGGDKREPKEVAAELVQKLIKEELVMRVERKFKRPKPGRTRLVKWPRTVLPYKDQVWDEAGMFSFTYDRPTSIWFYLAMILLPVVVVGACLFPLAPSWARMALVYFLMGLLTLMLGLTLVRYVIFTVVWITTGHSFWLFPNMMEEQASLVEAFTPIMTFTKAKSITENWMTRIAALLVCGSVLWLLASHTPDMAHIKEDLQQAHDSVFDYLDSMYGKNKGIEGGNSTGAATSDMGQRESGGKGGEDVGGKGSSYGYEQYAGGSGGARPY